MLLDAIGIVVSDLTEAMRFYRMLGLDFPEKVEAGQVHVEATTKTGLRVMLDDENMVKSFMPDWVKPVGQRMALAFLCDSPADVDRVHAAIVAAGFASAKEPWDAVWGQRYAQVFDPAGNKVDLFAPLS